MKATEYLKKVKARGQRSVLEPWLDDLTVLANASPPLSLDQMLAFLKLNGVRVSRSPLYRYLQRHVWKTRGRKAKGQVVKGVVRQVIGVEPMPVVASEEQGASSPEVDRAKPESAASPAVIDSIASAPVDLDSLARGFKKHQRETRGTKS